MKEDGSSWFAGSVIPEILSTVLVRTGSPDVSAYAPDGGRADLPDAGSARIFPDFSILASDRTMRSIRLYASSFMRQGFIVPGAGLGPGALALIRERITDEAADLLFPDRGMSEAPNFRELSWSCSGIYESLADDASAWPWKETEETAKGTVPYCLRIAAEPDCFRLKGNADPFFNYESLLRGCFADDSRDALPGGGHLLRADHISSVLYRSSQWQTALKAFSVFNRWFSYSRDDVFGKGTMLPLSGRRVNFRTEILRETPAMEAYENPWKAGERILVSRDSKSVFVSEGGWVLFSTEELSRAPDPALCPNTAGEFREAYRAKD